MEIKRPETREEMPVYMEEKNFNETIGFLRLIVAFWRVGICPWIIMIGQ